MAFCGVYATQAQNNSVGIDVPDGDSIQATLDIRGNIRITKVPISSNPTHVAVLNANDSILSRYNIDSLGLLISKKYPIYPGIIGWGFGVFGGGVISYPISFFKDKSDKIGVPTVNAVSIFPFEADSLPTQERDVTLDWSGIFNLSDFWIKGGAVSLSGYLYVVMQYQTTNERRVYRYDRNNLNAGGIRMIFSGLPLVNNGEPVMTSNGKDFFFSYNAGNGGDNTIAKYTVSGTTFSYVSSIVLGLSGDFERSFLVDSVENYYGLSNSGETKLKKFSSSGALLHIHTCYARYMMNWSNNLYLARSYPESYFEKFNK